jgi:FMN phosphatase YigB (HAD superfamily)/glycosyltransferase involved in cell wall biosynthesis
MRVAIVHYHLRPGGVTRVIEATARALDALGIETAVLTGESIPGLCYDETPGPEILAARLRAAIQPAPDVWIFHNPTLGKNRDLPATIEKLAREGEAILLHIHDLAEDGRPQNFANIPDPTKLHFTAPRVHHAFINVRDHTAFLAAGLPPDRAHLLPNPIEPAAIHQPRDGDALVFYPVRGIRRKNLGEVCLLAALAPVGTRFAVSLAPENPGELPNHDFWRMFAISHDLPVLFDVVDRIAPRHGHAPDFAAWCAHATHWLSTSVAEGFGQTLAEAAARRVPLIARRLDPGFVPSDPRGLYHRITLPGEPREFSELNETSQASAIARILESPATAVQIDGHPARAWLAARLADRSAPPADPQLTAHAPDAVARRLRDILATLTDPPAALAVLLPPPLFPRKKIIAPPVARREFPRAVIFDVYGTLLDAPFGGVRPDPAADPAILSFLENDMKPEVRQSPSTALAALVAREHAQARKAGEAFPEINLVALWAELLDRPADAALARLVADIEDTWHPATPMPGVADMLRRLAAAGIPCGLLSNAQANVWQQLGPLAPAFAGDLCVFSHPFLRAKPSPALFVEIIRRLARRGIDPRDAWFIGNDPAKDIAPAKSAGFRTAIFGPLTADADLAIADWADFPAVPGK